MDGQNSFGLLGKNISLTSQIEGTEWWIRHHLLSRSDRGQKTDSGIPSRTNAHHGQHTNRICRMYVCMYVFRPRSRRRPRPRLSRRVIGRKRYSCIYVHSSSSLSITSHPTISRGPYVRTFHWMIHLPLIAAASKFCGGGNLNDGT